MKIVKQRALGAILEEEVEGGVPPLRLWLRCRARETHPCVVCGEALEVGADGYLPLTAAADVKMLRLHRACGHKLVLEQLSIDLDAQLDDTRPTPPHEGDA